MGKIIEKLGNHLSAIKHFVIALDVLFLVLLLLNYYGHLQSFWNIVYIFCIILAFNVGYYALKINRVPDTLRDNLSVVYLSKYFFLLTLIILAVNQFLKRAIVADNIAYIVGFSIAFGFLTFYSSRDRVEREIEDEKSKEESDEKKRKGEFGGKFKRISRLNIDYGIKDAWDDKNWLKLVLRILISPVIFLVRLPYKLIRWCYVEGWWYVLALVVIVVLGFVLRVWNLGLSSFWNDEIIIVQTAKSLISGNWFALPSGIQYLYTIPSSLLVALSFLFFGINEFSARLPFAIIGTATIILNYFLIKKMLNKNMGILTSFALSLSLWLINYSREVRFYALNIFLAYLIIYYLNLYISSKDKKYFWISLILIILGAINHKLMLIFLAPWFFIFLLFNFSFKKNRTKKNYYLTIIILFILSLILFFYKQAITYYLFQSPPPYFSGGFLFYLNLFLTKFNLIIYLFFASIFSIKYFKIKSYRLLVLISLFVFIFFSFIIPTKSERYILIIYPFMLISVLFWLYNILRIPLKHNWLTVIFLLFLISTTITPFYAGYMVSQSKISYETNLQKNKYSWREATNFLSLEMNNSNGSYKVVTSNGMLTSFYGIEAAYTFKKPYSKKMPDNLNRSFYDGLIFIDDLESFEGYLIVDRTNLNEGGDYNLLKNYKSSVIYDKEGVMIYKKIN